MPPLPVLADVYRVTLNWDTGIGPSAHNVMHFRDVIGTQNKAALAADLITAWLNDQIKVVSADAEINSLSIIALDGTDATEEFVTGSGAKWVGDGSGDFAPALSCLVKLRTGFRGRERRGRLFLPFVAEDKATLGLISAGDKALMDTAWNNFVTAMQAEDWNMVVASYTTTSWADVVGLSTEIACGTQRRRQDQQRRN